MFGIVEISIALKGKKSQNNSAAQAVIDRTFRVGILLQLRILT